MFNNRLKDAIELIPRWDLMDGIKGSIRSSRLLGLFSNQYFEIELHCSTAVSILVNDPDPFSRCYRPHPPPLLF